MSTGVLAPVTPEILAKYEVVIGLEVHCQLGTRTKIFCGCPLEFGAAPNSNVCPVCLGLPGALPVLNKTAVNLAIRGALALQCKVQHDSIFARKNYFYPDSPKGYQISQFDKPYCLDGHVDVRLADGTKKRIGITRIHMEDDAGKSSHEGFRDSDKYSYIDLNRCGSPLIEIVSEPDLRSSDEAYEYMTEVKQALQFAEVSACDMEKGQLRCDANVSVRPWGQEKLGTRAEIKNLNSFRFLKQAIEYEVRRQVAIVEAGGKIVQETRLFDAESGETVSMRSKEDAQDYRYFPEPDLVPLHISQAWVEQVQREMPELPQAKRARFVEQHGLKEYDAEVLTQTQEIGDYYEKALQGGADPKAVANWVTGDLSGVLNAAGKSFAECPISAEHLGELVVLITKGELSGKLAKDIFPKMIESGEAPSVIMEREGLRQISDTGALDKILDEVIAANPKQVEQYRSGKTQVIGFLVGQVMKASRGQANPGAVNEMLMKKLQ